jgi:hypothetical protein
MSGTVIKPCSCKSVYQDNMYGKGMRVHNIKKDKTETCTVCQPGRRELRLKAHAANHKPT